jgi:hypothetical protein
METLYRLRCDRDGCGQSHDVLSLSREEARDRARRSGWQVGPFKIKTPLAIVTYAKGWAFCPDHKRTEEEG